MSKLLNPGSDELQALFDAAATGSKPAAAAVLVVRNKAASEADAKAVVYDPSAHDVFMRIGTITRKLHDALHELGYSEDIEGAVSALPDARSRLAYIARLTGEAAERVLNAVDTAKSAQDELDARLVRLAPLWERLASDGVAPAPELLRDTATFFAAAPGFTQTTNSQLTDIMMAQDFHDLTGQVIRKIVDMAQNLEEQLVKLLLETTPPERRTVVASSELHGPQVDTEGRSDIVTDQSQVDDLLAKLGF